MNESQMKKAFNEVEILQKISHPFVIKYRESFLHEYLTKKH